MNKVDLNSSNIEVLWVRKETILDRGLQLVLDSVARLLKYLGILLDSAQLGEAQVAAVARSTFHQLRLI